MSRSFDWATEHSLEICEKYAGKWIAIYDCGVVGVGDTATEAAEQAERAYSGSEFLLEKVDTDLDRV